MSCGRATEPRPARCASPTSRPGAHRPPFRGIVASNGLAYFNADDDINGTRLWRSDGTAAGTIPLVGGAAPASDLVDVDGTLFFGLYDGIGTKLHKTDGTVAGTVMVSTAVGIFGTIVNVNGTAFFPGYNSTFGVELWRSNGTAASTIPVADIYFNGDSDVGNLANVNGTLYFTATDGVHGVELWRSDGTTAGTALVSDINPGSASSFPRHIVNQGGVAVFRADNGVHGTELWKTRQRR